MADLISRAEVLDAISTEGGCGMCASRVLDILAVDVVPVVHGKWVRVHGYATPGGVSVWKCSICGKGKHFYGI